ncbi:MAG: hypothetical protein QQN63_05575 [Nitrosopumilus sp.]
MIDIKYGPHDDVEIEVQHRADETVVYIHEHGITQVRIQGLPKDFKIKEN